MKGFHGGLDELTFFTFKVLDAALKQFKSLAPKTAALLFSVDEDNGKIICLAQVPKVNALLAL